MAKIIPYHVVFVVLRAYLLLTLEYYMQIPFYSPLKHIRIIIEFLFGRVLWSNGLRFKRPANQGMI